MISRFKMKLTYNSIFLNHSKQGHPESKERLYYFKNLKETKIENGEKYLNLVYDKKYTDNIKAASKNGTDLDSDTYTNKSSYEVACYAAGAAILAAKRNDFALIRPPGHHANRERAMGFCLFNNIAIACKWLSLKNKKILVIDFDGHHGNGTQDIFYDDANILFVSSHQFPAYPGTGWINEIGAGDGKYFTVNLPLPPNSGDDIFIDSYSKVIPILRDKFKPDCVAISAGFDPYKDDPLLQLNLSINSFYFLGMILAKNFQNNFACLEGGYNVQKLPLCVDAFLNGINKREMQLHEEKTYSHISIRNKFSKRLDNLQRINSYWGFNF